MARCRKHGVRAPAVYHMDQERRLVIMERVTEGALLKDYIRSLAGAEDSDALSCAIIGASLSEPLLVRSTPALSVYWGEP